MENNFDSAKWIREFKTAIFEEKKEKAKKADDNMQKKGQAVHSKDLIHTTKVDDKKADKVDMKIGAENDLAIEKDKDGHDVYAGGLKEAFVPGNMFSTEFDYNGMLRYSVNMEIPDPARSPREWLEFVNDDKYNQVLKDLFESYQDVNYHTEAADLNNAIDMIEDLKAEFVSTGSIDPELSEAAYNELKKHKMLAAKTLKILTKGKM